MRQQQAVEAIVRKVAREGDDAALAGKTVRSCAESTRIFRSSIAVAQNLASQGAFVLAVLLVLFIVHQARILCTLRHHALFYDCPACVLGVCVGRS
jgi:hypothetical protein